VEIALKKKTAHGIVARLVDQSLTAPLRPLSSSLGHENNACTQR